MLDNHAYESASCTMDSIVEMVAALECDYDRLEELRDSKTMHYVAGWNMPGYMPDGEPAEFDDADDALEYIKDAAKDFEETSDEIGEFKNLEYVEHISQWKADKIGEFGETFGNYHYFVSTIGEKSDDDEALAELEEQAGECNSLDDAMQRIQEDPLSVEVRTGWYTPGETPEAEEFAILLCTGGPAVRIRGELDQYKQPCRAWLEFQDWGTPWTGYHGENVCMDTLLTYCQQFYFGE